MSVCVYNREKEMMCVCLCSRYTVYISSVAPVYVSNGLCVKIFVLKLEYTCTCSVVALECFINVWID